MFTTTPRRITVDDVEAPPEVEPFAPKQVASLVVELRRAITDLQQADRAVREAVDPANVVAATAARANAHAARVAAAQAVKTEVDLCRDQWCADLAVRREEQTRQAEEQLDQLVAVLAERQETVAAERWATEFFWAVQLGVLGFGDHPEYPLGQLRHFIRPATG